MRGTRPIAFASLQFFVEKFRREGIKNLAVVLPDDAPGYVTGGFSVLKQAKNVPHPNAASKYPFTVSGFNWYVSRPGQEVYQRTIGKMATTRSGHSRRTRDVDTGLPSYLISHDPRTPAARREVLRGLQRGAILPPAGGGEGDHRRARQALIAHSRHGA